MALDQATANELMYRMMTTGVPTAELDQYGGYDAVASLYNAGGGGYSRNEIPQDSYDSYAQQIANTGVGNLSALTDTNTPLTAQGLQNMANNGVDLSYDWLQQHNIPVASNAKTTLKSTTGGVATDFGDVPTDFNFDFYSTRQTPYLTKSGPVGASGNAKVGAGNANYKSALIQALRDSSAAPADSNQGFTFYTAGSK